MTDITSRRHWIMQLREGQLRLNSLALDGGRPYVEARLWRAPNETDLSWSGDAARDVAGRKWRTSLVNDAGRVARKIDQYIFGRAISRKNADETFLADCTGRGETARAFMERVNDAVTCGRWCWLQADRAPLAEGESESLANRPPIRWTLWKAEDVPDWCVGADGEIKWLITRARAYRNDDPFAEAKDGVVYTLYRLDENGRVRITEEMDGDPAGLALRKDEELPGLGRIPFALVGEPSEKAWWFDDVENVQAQILNLDSMHNETLTETVYPQLVVPNSLANSLELRLAERNVDGEKVAALVRELTIGRKIPILESAEDKGISRYIAPSGDLALLTQEMTRKRSLLFETAGMALFNRETRQVESAEAKRFDRLDTNATLANRALLLQDAERRMVELSKAFDPSFKAWEPAYPADFDVVDAEAMSAALAQLANMPDKTPLVRRIEAKAALRVLKELCTGVATDEEIADALEEIENTDFAENTALPDPFAGADDDGGLTQGDADEIYEGMMAKK